MRALISFTLQRQLRTNICRMQLLGYSSQPGCSEKPAGCITGGSTFMGTKQLSRLGVGLVISRSLVQFLAGALWSVLGQDSLFHIASDHPAEKWVPSINKAVLRACALYAASCSRISLRGWFLCVQCLL